MSQKPSQELEIVTSPQAIANRPQQRQSLMNVNIEELLSKAIDAKSAVEVFKELRAMRAEDMAIEAKQAFDAALSAFQSECPVIHKGRDVADAGGKRMYSFAPLDAIITEVKPLLQKHGFNYTLDTDVESKDGWVIAKCTVTHELGEKRTSTAKFPIGTGTRAMSTTQVFAAALTFASRRVFCNCFGIVTGEDDLDGAGPKPRQSLSEITGEKPVSKPQTSESAHSDVANKQKLVNLTRSIHLVPPGKPFDDAAKQKLDQFLHDELFLGDSQSLADLSGAPLADVVAKVEAKLRGKA